MKKLLLAFALLLPLSAMAQQSVVVPATMASTPIGAGTTIRSRIILGITGKQIYLTGINLVPANSAIVIFNAGTGTNCATGLSTPVGLMTFVTGQVLSYGVGNGAVVVIPSGDDVCITITGASAPGSVAYSQF